MSINIYKTEYKNQECIALENERLIVKVLPQCGSKIQSIYDKSKAKEYLYQTPYKDYTKSEYDTLFENGEFSGFDEMFPTISECFYPSGPWKGIKVPDHGEVWSLPWDCNIDGTSVSMSVYGVRFPYRVEKKLSFIKENVIRISYKAVNLSSFDFEFIWAAHPLFNCSENTVIVLPKSINSVINTVASKRLGDFGMIHNWPITSTPQGEEYDMSRISPESLKVYEKYYALGKVKEGWSALYDVKTKEVIGLSYPIEKVPYLGLWVNEGGYGNQYNAALEPCTGALDRVDTAKQWNQVSVIKAKGEYEWFLNLTFDTAEKINYIDESGEIK